MTKTFNACLLLLALLLHRVDAQSQRSAPAEASSGTTAAQEQPAEDPLGRSTPRGTAAGLILAAEQGNFDRAGEYLESELKPPHRQELARQLWIVLDRRLATSPDRLSDAPGGDPADGFSTRDRAGVVESGSGDVEIFLKRVTAGRGSPVWVFSATTLQDIPRLYDELQPPWIERYLPQRLRQIGWLSIPLYRWIGILVLVPLLFGLSGLSTRLLSRWLHPLFGRISRRPDRHNLASAGPLRLLMLTLLFYSGSFFGVSLATRQFWQRSAVTLAVVGLCWLSLRLVDAVAALSLTRLQRVDRSGDVALVRLLTRLSKATAVIVASLIVLYVADVDLTAALTGLGVGGLAIGFGAQKTIENLFGGIMVISDKPINVGDACKVGEFVGTVEDIGIRSTRIRTMDRTVVCVPNGQLASMILENFAMRDRMRFHHTIGLARQTSAEQVRSVLTQIRGLLTAHPKVDPSSARTRLIRFSGSTLDLEIFAYVLEREQAAFLAIQEDLLLAIMDVIDASGASFTAPVIAPAVAQGALSGGV